MKIIVVDNGSGFSQEVLELLNAGKQIKKKIELVWEFIM